MQVFSGALLCYNKRMKDDKYSPDYESFRELHAVVLNIFKTFQKICDENNLRYFAISGTTLGAALWKGIIPWDDDMDIAMPAQDFLKFKKLCKKHGAIPKGFSFTEYNWFGGKFHDNRTMCTGIHYISKPDRYTGVFIDIVPLIGIPDDKDSQKAFVDELNNFRGAAIIADRFDNFNTPYSKAQLDEWAKKFLTKYPFEKSTYVMDFSDSRYILKASGFQNPVLMPFEDTTIPVSSNYEEDLKIQYQNYSKYPPKNQRINQNQLLFTIDMKHSSAYYAKEYKKLQPWVAKCLDQWQSCAGVYYDCYTKELDKAKNMVSGQTYMNDLNAVYNSKSYKLGHLLLHPIKHLFKKK